jgi:toxin ParE1/3/4
VSFTIKRTLDARKDLVEIWSSIAVHDEEAATRLLDRIDEAIMRLEQFPRLGREREDIEPGLRGLLKDDYLILYEIRQTERQVAVLRVIHGRRDIAALFHLPE